MDQGHEMTDKKLEALEKELKSIYYKVFRESKKELKKVEFILEKYKDTLTDEARLKLWQDKSRLDKLTRIMTEEIAQANKIAISMINNELLNVYDLNFNWGAYKVETNSGYEIYTNLYNKNAVREILADNVNPFTMIALDELKDRKTIEHFLKREFMAGIIKGDSIEKLAERVKKVTQRNYNDSVRIARTETTRIESLGRQDAFKKGEEMGLKLKKKWNSTNDIRTRESHLLLQGEVVGLDENFSNGLEYPGAMGGKASEVINCRCSHTVEFIGVKKSAKLQELEEEIKRGSFAEWQNRFAQNEKAKKEPAKKEIPKKEPAKPIKQVKPQKEKYYTQKELNNKSNEELREIARQLALKYYPQSGLNFGSRKIDDVVNTLISQSKGKINLIKDIKAMQNKLKK